MGLLEIARIAANRVPKILDKINGTSGPPLPPFQWCQNGAFFAPSRLHLAFGGMGDNCSISYCPKFSLRKSKWNIWTHPPATSMMPTWRVFCSFAPSSLLWGGGVWGIIVPFYTVQDCSSLFGSHTVSHEIYFGGKPQDLFWAQALYLHGFHARFILGARRIEARDQNKSRVRSMQIESLLLH